MGTKQVLCDRHSLRRMSPSSPGSQGRLLAAPLIFKEVAIQVPMDCFAPSFFQYSEDTLMLSHWCFCSLTSIELIVGAFLLFRIRGATRRATIGSYKSEAEV